MQTLPMTSRELNVLLIEDNANDAELFENRLLKLRDREAKVETCTSLNAGLDRLSLGGINIIFLDLTLPDSSGLATLARVQKNAPTTPIIVLTGNDDNELASDALDIGAQDYLVKGHIDSGALGRSVNYAIGRQQNAEAAKWLRAVVESSNDAIYGENMDGVIQNWNQGAQQIYGYSAAEAIGKTIAIIMPAGSTDDKYIRERINRGEHLENYETTRRKKDGSEVVVSISAGAIINADSMSTGISFTARDMTRQRLDEEALKETNQRLKLALRSGKIGLWQWNTIAGTVRWDDRNFELFGISRNEFSVFEHPDFDLTIEQVISYVHPDDREHFKRQMSLVIEERRNYECEYRVVWPNNSVHDIEARGEILFDKDGKPQQMIGVSLDVTARKIEARRKLEAAKLKEQLAHSIVQHAPIGIVTFNSSLNVTDSNDAFAAMIHRDSNQLFNASLHDILPFKTFENVEAALRRGEPLQLSRQKVSIVDNGSELVRYWDMAFWPVATEEGALEEAVLQIIDCSETVNLEEQRDDFVAAIAHDIKNPLIGADRVLGILCNQDELMAPDAIKKMLSILKESNHNLLNLVKNLVDVYHYQTTTYPVHYQDVDIRALIASCIEQVANFAESRNVTITCSAAYGLPHPQADEVSIRRVLMNLLHNAIKFNKTGGKTSVFVRRTGDFLKIEVADAGVGIDKADQEKLFQRFSQGKAGIRHRVGTGLGLFLSKQIMLAHHGSISCESSVGSGSVFSINLPLFPPPLPQ